METQGLHCLVGGNATNFAPKKGTFHAVGFWLVIAVAAFLGALGVFWFTPKKMACNLILNLLEANREKPPTLSPVAFD